MSESKRVVLLKRALDRVRKRWVRRDQPQAIGNREVKLAGFADEILDKWFRPEELTALRRAIARLSDEERMVLYYRWSKSGSSLREIGKIVDLPAGIVADRLTRILVRLRLEMGG